MKVSVCMGIYNGEKFIEKQLQTLYKQSRPADEVILCDDCSTDDTVQIVKKFIADNGLDESWKLYLNTENKGYPGNFYYAMSLSTGDVVFPADQDDVWLENKIGDMLKVMESNPHIDVLASRWGIMDAEDNVLKDISRGQIAKKETLREITIKDILYCNDWPGMCMCYRNDVGQEAIKRVEGAQVPHDIALGMMAAEHGRFWCVSQVYQYHRRHEANVAMEEHRASKLLNKKRKLLEIEIYLKWLEELEKSSLLESDKNKAIIRDKKMIMEQRRNNLEKGRRLQMLKQYWHHRKDIRISTVLCDVLIAKGKENE